MIVHKSHSLYYNSNWNAGIRSRQRHIWPIFELYVAIVHYFSRHLCFILVFTLIFLMIWQFTARCFFSCQSRLMFSIQTMSRGSFGSIRIGSRAILLNIFYFSDFEWFDFSNSDICFIDFWITRKSIWSIVRTMNRLD